MVLFVKACVGIGVQGLPPGDGLVPGLTLGCAAPSLAPGYGFLVRRNQAGAPAPLNGHIAQRHARFDVHGLDHRAAVLHCRAACSAHAHAAYQRQRNVFGVEPVRQAAVQPDAHLAGLFHGHHLGAQHMHQLGGAATKGQAADGAYSRSVAVGAGQRQAGQGDAELRRDHVHDAVLRVVHIEHLHAVARARQQRGLNVRRDPDHAGPRGHGVVLHHHRQVGAAHAALAFVQQAKGVRCVQFMHRVTIHVKQVLAVGARVHMVERPNFVKQCVCHAGT